MDGEISQLLLGLMSHILMRWEINYYIQIILYKVPDNILQILFERIIFKS